MKSNWFSGIIRNADTTMKKQYITPIQINTDAEYITHLSNLYAGIKAALEDSVAPEAYRACVDYYGGAILRAVNYQYSGDTASAQQEIDNIMDDLIGDGGNIAVSPIKNSISFLDIDDALDGGESNVQFFRARTSDRFVIYDRKDMLHIPFDMRHLVATERFSIPGLPCLYLGSSSYCCWLEIGTPADHCFNVSSVEVDGDKQILNLTAISEIVEFCEDHIEEDTKKLTIFKLWLLTMATSYKVRQSNRSFKSEYIIPQLLMLSCKKKNLYGIAYYSKQLTDDRFAHHSAVNLAVFADYHGEKKLSSICKNIALSRSYNFAMYKQLMYSLRYKNTDLNVRNSAYPVNIGDFDRQVPYNETEFYGFDQFLFAQIAEEIETIDVDEINEE